MNKITKFSVSALSLLISQNALSQEGYPFTLPATVTATINVDTTSQEPYNNKLLGTNIFGFTSTTDQNLINRFQPETVRFPHGLWANWYDWETDGTRVFGTDSFNYTALDGSTRTTTLDHLAEIKIKDSINERIGINGLTILNSDKISATGKGYDMLWTFNMSADGSDYNNGSPQTLARYNDMISRGFEVNSIELGNENFYPGQRSSIIPETDDYIQRAKSMSAALKAINGDVRVSVPLLRRGNWANPNWNQDLTEDKSYFDAVTVHTYVGSNPDDSTTSDEAYSTALTARHHLAASVNDYAREVAPNKPIWLSEWGVKSGGPNAVSVLGMADAYLYMSENQHVYERANWFSVNGKLNSFLVWEDYVSPSGVVRQRIKYPLEKTAFGSSHEIIRSVLENSTMLDTTMTSPELISGVDAVSARVAVKDNVTTVFVLNLTNKPVPFNVQLDSAAYNGAFHHKAMAFTWMGQEQVLPIDTNPLTTIKEGSGAITLPKFSMSTIVLVDSNIVVPDYTANVIAPYDGSSYTLGESIALRANVQNDDDIKQVNFRINGAFYKQDNVAPYLLNWTPVEAGDYTIDVVAIDVNGKRKTSPLHTFTVKGKVAALPKPPTISFPVNTMTVDEGYEKLVLTFNPVTPEEDRTIVSVTLSINGQVMRKDTRPIWNFGHSFAPHETGAMGWLDHHEPNPNPLGVGEHLFSVVAEDSEGLTTEANMTLIVKAVPVPEIFGDLDNDGDVDKNDLSLFSSQVSNAELLDLAYDFNGDGTLSRRDNRGFMKLCTRSRCATE